MQSFNETVTVTMFLNNNLCVVAFFFVILLVHECIFNDNELLR